MISAAHADVSEPRRGASAPSWGMTEGKPLFQVHRALANLRNLRAFLWPQTRNLAAVESLGPYAEVHVRRESPAVVEVVLGRKEYPVHCVEFGIW